MADGQLPSAKRRAGLRSRLRRNWRQMLLLGLATVVVVWLLWPQSEDRPEVLVPRTAPVVRGDIENLVVSAGKLEAGREVKVGLQVDGEIKAVHVRLGDEVEAGDLLAEVDDFIQQGKVATVRADVETAISSLPSEEASLAVARKTLDREQRLMAANASTPLKVEQHELSLMRAENTVERSRQNIEKLKTALAEAEKLLDHTRVIAPSSGTVVEVNFEAGETVNTQMETPILLTIGDLDTIRIRSSVSQLDIHRLEPGMAAYFTIYGGGERRWKTFLKEISPLPKSASLGGQSTVSFEVLLEMENTDRALLPEMHVTVYFVEGSAADVLKVPIGALSFSSGAGRVSAAAQYAAGLASRESGPANEGAQAQAVGVEERGAGRFATVQVVNSEGGTQIRQVQIGVSNKIEAEVLSGLKEGELVIVGIQQPPPPEGLANQLTFGPGR